MTEAGRGSQRGLSALRDVSGHVGLAGLSLAGSGISAYVCHQAARARSTSAQVPQPRTRGTPTPRPSVPEGAVLLLRSI